MDGPVRMRPRWDQQASANEFQTSVWRRLLPQMVARDAVATFRSAREALVAPYPWVRGRLEDLAQEHSLWCVSNGTRRPHCSPTTSAKHSGRSVTSRSAWWAIATSQMVDWL